MLWFVNLSWSLLLPALFLFTGFSAKIRTWVQRLGKKWFFVIAIYFAILAVTNWIDPLFNDFGPMKDQALEAKILTLAEKAGIIGSRVYEVNKSVDTETVNAYVTGFLGTKRIVLWDTILAKLDENELLFVIGHEMGIMF